MQGLCVKIGQNGKFAKFSCHENFMLYSMYITVTNLHLIAYFSPWVTVSHGGGHAPLQNYSCIFQSTSRSITRGKSCTHVEYLCYMYISVPYLHIFAYFSPWVTVPHGGSHVPYGGSHAPMQNISVICILQLLICICLHISVHESQYHTGEVMHPCRICGRNFGVKLALKSKLLCNFLPKNYFLPWNLIDRIPSIWFGCLPHHLAFSSSIGSWKGIKSGRMVSKTPERDGRYRISHFTLYENIIFVQKFLNCTPFTTVGASLICAVYSLYQIKIKGRSWTLQEYVDRILASDYLSKVNLLSNSIVSAYSPWSVCQNFFLSYSHKKDIYILTFSHAFMLARNGKHDI